MKLDADFMHRPETRRVLAAFAAAGAPVRFVGGCVRDALLKRVAGDIDLCTPLPPAAMIPLLEAAGIKTVPTGIEHGTVTAVADHHPFEITTLRRDVSTDGRRATVAFTDDWREDAARRDLTINALSAEPDGTVHDYFDGIADLAAGCIRFVGDPQTRLTEDVLRLLRFYRFHAWFGRPPFDEASIAACRAMAHALPRLSAERVRAELLKLLAAPDPLPAFQALQGDGGLAHWLPEADDGARLAALAAAGGPADPLLRLASLIEAPVAPAIASRLKLSNRERATRLALLAPEPALTPGDDAAQLRDGLYRLGFELAAGRLWLAARGQKPVRALGLLAGMERPVLPIAGRDLIALGMEPGPSVARILKAVESWWRQEGFSADRDGCLATARRLMTEGGSI